MKQNRLEYFKSLLPNILFYRGVSWANDWIEQNINITDSVKDRLVVESGGNTPTIFVLQIMGAKVQFSVWDNKVISEQLL